MQSALNHWVALLLLWVTVDAGAEPPLSETLTDTAQAASRLSKERAADQTLQSASQAQLARDIDAAYTKKHGPTAEDVTTGLDGTDKVFRIRTPLGANLCLNYRDVDRFNAGKGKRVFVLACNR